MSLSKKSKFTQSLSKVLTESSSKQKEDTVGQEENVTLILDNKIDSGDDVLVSDPFHEAANSGNDDVISVEKSIKNDELPFDQPSIQSKKEKPQKLKFNKSKSTTNQNKSIKVISGVAIVLSSIAIIGSGYSILSQEGVRQKLTEGFVSIESSISDLTDRSDLFQSSLSGITSDVSANTADISKLKSLQSDLANIHQEINLLRSEANQVNDLLITHKQTLGDHGSVLSELQKSVKKLNERPKPVVRKVSATKTPPKKVITNSNTIEGAELSTIDRWGLQSYVVLRDSDGKWIPLQRGDVYKGWRFTGITGEKAFFNNGSQTKKLTVET